MRELKKWQLFSRDFQDKMVGVIELGPEQMGGTTIQELAASTATETASVRGASFTNTAYG